jgi:2-polyprenyl-3-methyl-5-hydroxy-6-metoxy-1,4-benzoquinol methylase
MLKALSPRLTGWFGRAQDALPSTPVPPPTLLELGVTPEAVGWAYRILLGREPESPEAVEKHVKAHASLEEMRNRMLSSPEYRTKNPPAHVPALTGHEPPLLIEDVRDSTEMSRILDHIGQTWQRLGEIDPHWSVITAERFHAENIKETEAEFYNSGQEPADHIFTTLKRNGVDPSPLRTCLEYGCGLGRVTAWLARRFEHVFGYDISASHLQTASIQLEAQRITNVTLRQVKSVADIHDLERVDLVYSIIVLQHNPPPVIRLIIRGLLRAVKPAASSCSRCQPTARATSSPPPLISITTQTSMHRWKCMYFLNGRYSRSSGRRGARCWKLSRTVGPGFDSARFPTRS